jgi:hypothetical protein
MIDLKLPDGWEIKQEGALFAHPKDDESFIVSMAPLESNNDKVLTAFMMIQEGENKLLEEVKKLVPFI